MSADWRLVCERLSIDLGTRRVVQDVSLALTPGECVSLVGPNGSGKTTLLRALLGLLPPTSGAVRLNGRDIRDLPPRARGRFAAYVPQIVDSLPAFRVHDVVAGGRFAHVPPLGSLRDADHAAVRRALKLCGLTPLADRPVDEISGGERQKTLIAAAIAQDPQLMFLDEPNTALDPGYQLDLVRILRGWNRSGRALLLISHDLQLPAALGGRVVALRGGRVAADGPAEEVLTVERLAEIYAAHFRVATTAADQPVVLPDWWRAGESDPSF